MAVQEFGDNRAAHIFSLLCTAHSIETNALAARLNVSERTVRNDIKQLNARLGDCAAIEGEQGVYTLHVYHSERFREIRTEILAGDRSFNSPHNRLDYLFGNLMRAEAPLLTDELAYEMSIGRSTIISDLKKLRASLEPYHLAILGKTSKGLILQGAESNIRSYILDNSYGALYRDYPLDKEILELTESVFLESPLERGTQETFKMYLTVMLDRFLTGHPIGELSTAFYRLTARPEFETVNRLTGRISQFLHVEIPIEEQLFVLLPIVGMRTPSDVLDMRAIELDWSMQALKDKVFRQIQMELNIQLADPEFEEEFLYHLMFMLNRLRFHVRLRSAMLTELREKYPLAWRMAGIAARVIQEEYALGVTEDERGYLASYFGVFLEENGLKNSRAFRAAVVCGTGRVTARLIAAQLRRVLDSSAELVLFPSGRVTPESLEGFDLIFTTVELPCRTDLPVIFIHEIFNEQEIRHKIEKAKYWDQVDVPVLDNNWFVMTGLLDESRFFVLDKEKDYSQVLERMAGALTEQGKVDEGFLERLRSREQIGSTVFDHSIAMPHTVQYAGDRLVLAAGVCPKPVWQDGREIRVVFMLGLPEQTASDGALLVRVYEEIISITRNREMLEKIAAADNFQALLRALYRQA
ncbi:MAG: PTS sugar transporter subunit IIA [Oscillospiraceae bacterium]|nr:PTS sugar transporter subunit IIA [Oscillospiraceae bacterium]